MKEKEFSPFSIRKNDISIYSVVKNIWLHHIGMGNIGTYKEVFTGSQDECEEYIRQ